MVSRRKVFGSLAAPLAANAQFSADDVTALGAHADTLGLPLTSDRLKILKPLLERRKVQLASLRAFAVDDATPPTVRMPWPPPTSGTGRSRK